jgi:DUF4097 and DUF4098 domain-containing protein YvlB
MKLIILFLLQLSISFSIKAQRDGQKPYLTQSLSAESIRNVEVQTSGGRISLTGVKESEARIEVYVNGNNNNELSADEIKKRIEENYELQISVDKNTVMAKAKPKKGNMDWKKSLSVSFHVFVPQNTSSELSTSGGSIHLKGLSGTQDFETSGGSLHVEDVTGKVKGRTSGGSIEAENCSGDIELLTSGGSLDLNSLEGNVRASTSGGSIAGKNIRGEFTAHTSGGSIRLSDLACSLEASTSGGHINIAIKDYGKYVRIDNSGGDIDLHLPKGKGIDLDLEARKVNTTTMANFKGSIEKDRVKGTLDGGGIPVKIKAHSGHIDLSMN